MYHEDEETPVSKFADFKLPQPLFCFRLGRRWLPPSFQQARGHWWGLCEETTPVLFKNRYLVNVVDIHLSCPIIIAAYSDDVE